MEEQIQRKYTRWEINHDAQIKLGGSTEASPCRVRNISLKGIELSFDRDLEKEKPNKLRLSLCDGVSCQIEGWVMWHKTSDGLNSYGLYFTRISDADKEKIYSYVLKHAPRQVHGRMFGSHEPLAQDMTVAPDRRDFERFSLSLPVVYSDPLAQFKGAAQTADMSATGLGMIANQPLIPGTLLSLEVRLTDQVQYIRLNAWVIWSKQIAPDNYRIGVKLDHGHLMSLGRLLRTRQPA